MRGAISAIGLALAALAVSSTDAAAQLKTLTTKGDASPVADYVYRLLEHPAVGDADGGTVAFLTRLQGTVKGARPELCIVKVVDEGASSTVACKDDPAPGGGVFRTVDDPVINAAGLTAWRGELQGGDGGAIFREGSVVVRQGDDIGGGQSLSRFGGIAVNDAGHVVFLAAVSNAPGTEQGIFRCAGNCSDGPEVLETLVRKGDVVYFRPDRRFCSLQEVGASTHGAVFRASTKVDCNNSLENDRVGIFVKPFGGPGILLALQGGTADPASGGTTYGPILGVPAIANDGRAAFLARVVAGEDTLETLFQCTPVCIAAVPKNTDDGQGNLLGGFGDPVVGGAGDLAFRAKARGGVCGVYIRRSDGTIDTVMAKGDTVPGETGGFRCTRKVSMSTAGRAAFAADFAGPGTKPSRGIFLFE